MEKTTTLPEATHQEHQPRPQTIRNILAFSRAYHCAALAGEEPFEMIKN